MNGLFGISKDTDMLTKPLANRDKIEAFENEVRHGPAAPYLPDLYNIKSVESCAVISVHGIHTKIHDQR